jgi:hypothetical protein
MARKPAPTDFNVSVDGIGAFVFARRKMADEIKIQVEYSRLIEGVEPTYWLSTVAGWIAAFKVLTVVAPENWDIDEMDPTDDVTYANMNAVHKALCAKEGSFRGRAKEVIPPERTGDVQDSGVLVSP